MVSFPIYIVEIGPMWSLRGIMVNTGSGFYRDNSRRGESSRRRETL